MIGFMRDPAAWTQSVVIVTLACAAASLVLDDPAGAGADSTPPLTAKSPPRPPEFIEIVVRAKDTGKTLPGATVRATMDMTHHNLKADAEGRVRVNLSRRMFPNSFGLDVWAPGYVQQRFFYSQTDARSPKTPTHVEVELLPGEETLGGTVADEQGRPIAGVTVKIWGYLGEKKRKNELAYMIDTITDRNGQWHCRCFRSMTFAYLYLSHPDYLTDGEMNPRRFGSPQPNVRVRAGTQPGDDPLRKLRDFSDSQVMARGVELSGKVVDHRARPVAGAEVGWMLERQKMAFHENLATMRTDAQGRFHFGHVRTEPLLLQVKAKAHAPLLTTLTPNKAVILRLEPPNVVTGRVVNIRGKPISDAFVCIDSWRGCRALGVFLKTGNDGGFRWEDAPADEVLVNADATGYKGVFLQPVSPGREAVFTLRRALSISGRIRDAKTKKAIDDVSVWLGIGDLKTGLVRWSTDQSIMVGQGYLQADIDAEHTTEFRLRFRAKGYEPVETRVFHREEGQAECDIDMNPTDKPDLVRVSASVRRADGAPLAGADVAVIYPIRSAIDRTLRVGIANGKLRSLLRDQTAKTDADGRFGLNRQPDPEWYDFALVIVHPEYHAEVRRADLEANPTIVAKPWGRVSGVARVGRKPAAGQVVRYLSDQFWRRDAPFVVDSGETVADADGRFVLDHVMPGEVRVSIATGQEPGMGWTNGTLVQVESGKAADVVLGGGGRPVVARVVTPEGLELDAEASLLSSFSIVSDRPEIPYPEDLASQGEGAREDWAGRWWDSPEGREYRRNFHRFGEPHLLPNGILRVEDVPPGAYRITVNYVADRLRTSIASVAKPFVIPPIPGGRSDEPLDLGELRPEPRQPVKKP